MYYTNTILPKLIEDCNKLKPNDFIFQQDGAPAHTSRLAQYFIVQYRPDFIKMDDWPPNSPDFNPPDSMSGDPCCKSIVLSSPNPETQWN